MVVTNSFWKTKHQTLWTDEFQASPKGLPGRGKKTHGNGFCELYVSLLKLDDQRLKTPSFQATSRGDVYPPPIGKKNIHQTSCGWCFCRWPFCLGSLLIKRKHFTNWWFPIKLAHGGFPSSLTQNFVRSLHPFPSACNGTLLSAFQLLFRRVAQFFASVQQSYQIPRTKTFTPVKYPMDSHGDSWDFLGNPTSWGRLLWWFALSDNMEKHTSVSSSKGQRKLRNSCCVYFFKRRLLNHNISCSAFSILAEFEATPKASEVLTMRQPKSQSYKRKM